MKVILNSDVANLGEEGDVLDVANGYARNFLLPQGLVLEHSPRNIAKLEERREAIEQRKASKRTEAMSVKDRLESEDLVITMTAGRNGKLFGSVSSATIADQLSAKGIDVERKKIEVPDKSLKSVGNYKVKIRLYGGAEAVLTVRIEADAKTAGPTKEAEQPKEKSEDTAAVAVESDAVDEADTDEEVSAEAEVSTEAEVEAEVEPETEAKDEIKAEAEPEAEADEEITAEAETQADSADEETADEDDEQDEE